MLKKLVLFSALLVALPAIVSADSLLENGDFSAKPIKPWKLFSLKGTPATKSAVSEGVLTVKAAGATDKPMNRQLVQEVKVESGKKYRLDFDLKGDLEKKGDVLVVLVRSKGHAKGHYGLWRKIDPTAEWKTHTLYFKAKEIDPADAPVLKFQLGTLQGDLSFRNVKLIEARS